MRIAARSMRVVILIRRLNGLGPALVTGRAAAAFRPAEKTALST
jgi:hypothetical protein